MIDMKHGRGALIGIALVSGIAMMAGCGGGPDTVIRSTTTTTQQSVVPAPTTSTTTTTRTDTTREIQPDIEP